jgi:hypothetical protein
MSPLLEKDCDAVWRKAISNEAASHQAVRDTLPAVMAAYPSKTPRRGKKCGDQGAASVGGLFRSFGIGLI